VSINSLNRGFVTTAGRAQLLTAQSNCACGYASLKAANSGVANITWLIQHGFKINAF
jgi:hypothetical protein